MPRRALGLAYSPREDMTKATKPTAKRIACVGEDDPTYITELVRGLEQRGMTARHMSVFSLRLAPRPPDLTVLFGSAAKDGGVEMVTQLGEQRGPFAIVMAKGALAARLEARQRGLHVLPRAERGEEMAPLVAKLLAEIEGGATATTPPIPIPSPSPIALDGLDWDDEHDALTVNTALPIDAALPEPDAPVSSSAKTVKPAAPRPPRSTLIGGFPNFPKPKRPPGAIDPARAPDETAAKPETRADAKPKEPPPPKPIPPAPPLIFDEATEVGADVHSAVTRPHTIDPTSSGEGETKALIAPEIFEDTLSAPKPSLELAPPSNAPPSPAAPDAGVTAPHPAIFAGNEAVTAEQDALFASRQEESRTTEHDALERRFPQPSASASPAATPKQGRGMATVLVGFVLLLVSGAALAGGLYVWMFRSSEPTIAQRGPDDPHAVSAPPADEEAAPLERATEEDPAAAEPEAVELAEQGSALAGPEAIEAIAEPEAIEAIAERDDTPAPELADAPAEAPPAASAQAAPSDFEDSRALSDTLVAEAEAHRRAGRLAEAHATFTRAADAHPHNPHAHAGLARLALAMGDAPAAVEHAERAARLRRRRPEYHVLLGDMRREAGNQAGARAAYEQALELDPDHAQARARLGE